MKHARALSALLLAFSAAALSAQTPSYIRVTEVTGTREREITSASATIDIDSSIRIEFDLESMRQHDFRIRPMVFARRGAAVLQLPENALSDHEIYPDSDPTSIGARVQLTVSGNDRQNQSIVLDLRGRNERLRAQGAELRENDRLFLTFYEVSTSNQYTVELELVDVGLGLPTEIAAPLMVFVEISEQAEWRLGTGLSGVFHYNSRNGLQDYLGFGLTITPNVIDISASQYRIGVVPTISVGFGARNPDVLLGGIGPVFGTNVTAFQEWIGFLAINMSWITRVIRPVGS